MEACPEPKFYCKGGGDLRGHLTLPFHLQTRVGVGRKYSQQLPTDIFTDLTIQCNLSGSPGASNSLGGRQSSRGEKGGSNTEQEREGQSEDTDNTTQKLT